MKAEDLIQQLDVEIKEKSFTLAVLETDKLFRNLAFKDIRFQVNKNVISKHEYMIAYVKSPLRKYMGKMFTRCIGNKKTADLKSQRMQEMVIVSFKKRWEETRNQFDILKTIL